MFPDTADARRIVLTAALRSVRRKRRMTLLDTARAMGMPRRSYQHFESGGGRFNLETLLRFAVATDSDPIALLAAMMLAAPALASEFADNKLAMILVLTLDEFHEGLRDKAAKLDAERLLAALQRMFADLSLPDAPKHPMTAQWLAERFDRIAARTRQFEGRTR